MSTWLKLTLTSFAAALLLNSNSAHAQFAITSKTDYPIYQQYEPIEVVTTINSQLGQPAVFNLDGDNLRFYYVVRDVDGLEVANLPDVELPHPVMIPARATGSMTNNLLRVFPLSRTGSYSVQPCINWMGKTFRGEKQHFEIVSGRELSRLSGQIQPDRSTRTYRISHINRKQQDHVLLRIDDEDNGLCYGVFMLGRTTLDHKPELAMDIAGNAHVLYQNAPEIYIHSTYSPFGKLLDQKVIGRGYTNIGLKSTPDGQIEASGKLVTKENAGAKMIKSIIDNR